MDKATRDAIRDATQRARQLLEGAYRDQLEGRYDILANGAPSLDQGNHLSASERHVRKKLLSALGHERLGGATATKAMQTLIREMAFTTLNRFVALKMLEARDLVHECVSNGEQSAGFTEFVALSPGLVALPDNGYRLYLESLFDEIGQEIKVLFDRSNAASLLWPDRRTLLELLGILNDTELAGVWVKDETLGWVYQFFNSEKENNEAKYDRDGRPKPPLDSRELAVRNQFFTPEYVVRFLVDNTLGRLWMEMREGRSSIAQRCRFLAVPAGSQHQSRSPEQDDDTGSLPRREKKDPRDIRVLDPACGSGHFLLYAFSLFQTIYEEAWGDPDSPPSKLTGSTLRADFPERRDLLRQVPQLVLAHNLYGVDIDSRTAQIAALALWMRAQTAWAQQETARNYRPAIRRTNIAIAEPMPGGSELWEAFTSGLTPPALRHLADEAFKQTQIADEAGMLLKIERNIQGAIREAQERWESRPRQLELVPGQPDQRADTELFDVNNLPPADFWLHAESKIYRALRDYAEGGRVGSQLQRRLFAEDTAAGIAFIDVCRLRYDVIVMNPPFGTATPKLAAFIEQEYPSSKQDLFAPFVERAVTSLGRGGLVGVLSTEMGFFRRTSEPWRRRVLLARSSLTLMAHLGGHVLDGATVRTAAYVLKAEENDEEATFLRLFGLPDKEDALGQAIRDVVDGQENELVFRCPQDEFEKLPYAAFGYWCSPALRDAFVDLPRLEENHASVRVGLQTSDDFRFLRLRWEVPAAHLGTTWLPFAKGGEYSPYHDDVHLQVNWGDDARELNAWGHGVLRNTQHYTKPGLTWPRRTNKRFAPRALAGSCAFGDKGPAIVEINGEPLALLALLNSRPLSYFISLSLGAAEAEGGAGANSYEVGLVQRLPIPASAVSDPLLADLGRRAWLLRAEADTRDESTALFCSPLAPLSDFAGPTDVARRLLEREKELSDAYVELQHEIDEKVRQHYNLALSDWKAIVEEIPDVHVPEVLAAEDPRANESFAARLVQYLLGVAFGRWDLRIASGDLATPPLPDPLAPQPHRPPGMLTPSVEEAEVGLGGQDNDTFLGGVLVDDPGHELDLSRQLSRSLKALFPAEGDPAESVAGMLGESDLTTYFRKSKGLFALHLRTYSKSRRKAPVYWQLSTPSSSYSIWCYYHRFNRDTFYQLANDLVRPKVEHEERRLTSLRQEIGLNPSTQQRRGLQAQQEFVAELRGFLAEIERIAPLWNPDLNDGVAVNFALLWRLVPQHKAWQRECRTVWDKLVRGDLDWAHLAMHLWPERVVRKCRKERSLAIAHGLEAAFWYEDSGGKWKPREITPARVDELIAERSSAAVKAALEGLLTAPAPSGGNKRGRNRRTT
ncbi:MAG: BREX-1 system adenine-specific DNA-methyltransferase PglX [Rhodothermales bacterium]|nr:BREX-1 system adenine-specific DNA-methyltransferase PglX [Rhodothermales bacterium]MBO6778676.1 BREX-1 system adenine-specific DNA-methyltransferase PglX [Rhodothermales bacterium]